MAARLAATPFHSKPGCTWRGRDAPARGDVPVVPDWIYEIVSPSNAAHDRVTKALLYLEHGLPFFWLLDPAGRTLEVLKREDRQWVRSGAYDETSLAQIPPFEEIELEVQLLFPPVSI